MGITGGIDDKLEKIPKFVSIQVEPTLESSNSHSHKYDKYELFSQIHGFINFGKVVGLLPCNVYDETTRQSEETSSSSSRSHGVQKISVSLFFSFVGFAAITLNLTFGFLWIFHGAELSVRTPLAIALFFRYTFFSCWGWAVFLIFFLRHKSLQKLFRKWTMISYELEYASPDTSLRRHVIFLGFLIFSSAILENLMLDHFRLSKLCNKSSSEQGLIQCYYLMVYPHWNNVFGYHSVLCIIVFFIHKWMWYALNYVDVLIAVLARALYGKFMILDKTAKETLLRSTLSVSEIDNEKSLPKIEPANNLEAWVKVYQDHRSLCKLLLEMDNFFSPIIFCSYAFNMYFISLQVFDGLNGSDKPGGATQTVYEVWSVIHLIMRIGIITVSCARINKYAHKIRDVYRECPEQFYNTQIAREDMRVTSGSQIGLSAMGYFVLTQSSLLSVVSVIFTVEIILLQCLTTNTPTN